MSKQKRRHFKPEDKVKIIRRHLIDKVSISELCEEFNIKPNQYYMWQKLFHGVHSYNTNLKIRVILISSNRKFIEHL